MIAFAAALALFSAQEAVPTDDSYRHQRQRLAALIAEGDCEGAHGAVFVLGDRRLLEWVETMCPLAALDLVRWHSHLPSEIDGMYTDAQVRAARALANGEEVPVGEEPYDPRPEDETTANR